MKTLMITKPDGQKEPFSLGKPEIIIGRDNPKADLCNDLNLPHVSVSRRHARIFLEDGVYFIEDLKSVNKTWVNGQPIKRVELQPGDLIAVGNFTLQFLSQETKVVNPLDYIVCQGPLDPFKTIDANYFILQRLSELLVTQTSLPNFLRLVRDMVVESIRAAKGLIILSRPDGTPCLIVPEGETGFSREVVSQAMREKKSMLVGYDLSASKTMLQRGVNSAMCAPLVKGEMVSGVIYLEDPMPGVFGEGDLILLTLFANQVAAGLERVELNKLLQKEAVIRANLERFFSPKVVEAIARDSEVQGELAIKSKRIKATILFSDIKSFTLLSAKLGPESIADLLTRYFTLMSEIIFSYEGTLDKYLGDGLIAVFGAPNHYPDHALRAVKAAVDMHKQHRKLTTAVPPNMRFNIRVGINTGEVVAGYMGSPTRMEYSVLGETVIMAQRLEALAEPDTIYVGRETYRSLANYFPAECLKLETPKEGIKLEAYRIIPPI
jgi:adenylate cyclase